MVQLKDELWKYQYDNRVVIGRYGVAPPSSVMISEVDDDFTSGYTVNSGIFNPAGSGNYTISSHRKHIDAQRVENLMCWFDELAVAHKFSTSPYNLENLTVSSGGFNWTIHNGIERVSFTPQYDASGLFGYSWADNDLWKQIRGAISFVCDNLNVVPPHDLTDYSGEYRFASITSVHNPSGGVWPSRWGGQILSSVPYEAVSPSGFGGPGATGVYYEHHTLGLWLPPTDETDWSKSIPSGINSAEGGDFGVGGFGAGGDFGSLAKNNYGQIGQYGALSTDEYKQYFPTTGQSNLIGFFEEVGVKKEGVARFGPHRQYARVNPDDGSWRSFMCYLHWSRDIHDGKARGTYTYNFKIYEGLFNYNEPIVYTHDPHFQTPPIYQAGYLKEPDVWTFGYENEILVYQGYNDYTPLYPYYFAFVYKTKVLGPDYYFKTEQTKWYVPSNAVNAGIYLWAGSPPGWVFAFNYSNQNWYYPPADTFENIGGRLHQINLDVDTVTLVSTDISTAVKPNDRIFGLLRTGFNPNFPTRYSLTDYYNNNYSPNYNTLNDISVGSVAQKYGQRYFSNIEVPDSDYYVFVFSSGTLGNTKYYAVDGSYDVISSHERLYPQYEFDGSSWVYGYFYQAHVAIKTVGTYLQSWRNEYDNLTKDKSHGEVLYGTNVPNYDYYSFGSTGATEVYKRVGNRRATKTNGAKVLINPSKLSVSDDYWHYKTQLSYDNYYGYQIASGYYKPYYEEQGATFVYKSNTTPYYNYRESARDEWKLMDDIPTDIESNLTSDVQSVYASSVWVSFNSSDGVVDNYHKFTSVWGGSLSAYNTHYSQTPYPYNGNQWFGKITDVNQYGVQIVNPSSIINGISNNVYCEVSGKYEFKQEAKIFYTYVDNSTLRNKFGLHAKSGLFLKGSIIFGMGKHKSSDDGYYSNYTFPNHSVNHQTTDYFQYDGIFGGIPHGWGASNYTSEGPKTFKIAKGWVDYGSGKIDVNSLMNNLGSASTIFSATGETFKINATTGQITPPTVEEFNINFDTIVDEVPPFDNALFYLVYYMEPVDLTLPPAQFYWNHPIDEKNFTYSEQKLGGSASVFSDVSMTVSEGEVDYPFNYGVDFSGTFYQYDIKPSGVNNTYFTGGDRFGGQTYIKAISATTDNNPIIGYLGQVYNRRDYFDDVFINGYYGYVYSGRPLSIGHDNQLHQF